MIGIFTILKLYKNTLIGYNYCIMKTFKYETHLHTSEGSACGSSRGADYIKAYYDIGYSGIFVTDHFFGGNTAASRTGNWENRINEYCSGYESALKAATIFNKENNLTGDNEFKVFFGIEQTFDGDDYLIYGLDKQWLLSHPEVEHMRHKEIFEAVNSVKGLMIQAHPFRFRQYMRDMHQHPLEVHGVEIYNGGNKNIENQMAELYAQAFNFPITSGSDIHNINFLIKNADSNSTGGMEFTTPLKDVYDYADRVKFNKGTIIK